MQLLSHALVHNREQSPRALIVFNTELLNEVESFSRSVCAVKSGALHVPLVSFQYFLPTASTGTPGNSSSMASTSTEVEFTLLPPDVVCPSAEATNVSGTRTSAGRCRCIWCSVFTYVGQSEIYKLVLSTHIPTQMAHIPRPTAYTHLHEHDLTGILLQSGHPDLAGDAASLQNGNDVASFVPHVVRRRCPRTPRSRARLPCPWPTCTRLRASAGALPGPRPIGTSIWATRCGARPRVWRVRRARRRATSVGA